MAAPQVEADDVVAGCGRLVGDHLEDAGLNPVVSAAPRGAVSETRPPSSCRGLPSFTRSPGAPALIRSRADQRGLRPATAHLMSPVGTKERGFEASPDGIEGVRSANGSRSDFPRLPTRPANGQALQSRNVDSVAAWRLSAAGSLDDESYRAGASVESNGACRSRSDMDVTGSGHEMARSGSSNAIDTSSVGSWGRSMR